jgi:predicted  nucleic acid-binding Zn-ribbon protein
MTVKETIEAQIAKLKAEEQQVHQEAVALEQHLAELPAEIHALEASWIEKLKHLISLL